MEISFFETRSRISFYQSRVSRREQEIDKYFSRSGEKKLSKFSREFALFSVWLYLYLDLFVPLSIQIFFILGSLTYRSLFRMCPIGLRSLFSFIIVAFGTFSILSYLTPEKVGLQIIKPSHLSRCTVIRTFWAIFPTPQKSYALIFFGVHRTLFWSN